MTEMRQAPSNGKGMSLACLFLLDTNAKNKGTRLMNPLVFAGSNYLGNFGKRHMIFYETSDGVMIFKDDCLRATEIPASHALDAILDAINFGRLAIDLGRYNHRVGFIFTRLWTDDDAFVASDTTFFIACDFKSVAHRFHSLTKLPR